MASCSMNRQNVLCANFTINWQQEVTPQSLKATFSNRNTHLHMNIGVLSAYFSMFIKQRIERKPLNPAKNITFLLQAVVVSIVGVRGN